MIIACPSCSTRYTVSPLVVGDGGRRVRCARCGHTWIAAEAPADDAGGFGGSGDWGGMDDAPPPPPSRRYDDDTPMPPGMSRPATARPSGSPRRDRAGWAALALVTATLLVLIVTARDDIVPFWPPSLRLYQTLGLGVAPAGLETVPGLGAGLTLRNVATEVTEGVGGDVLWVRGEVANLSEVARAVPALQIALTDPDGRTLHRWAFTAGVARLAPGEAARFETSLRNPDATVAKLELSAADGAS